MVQVLPGFARQARKTWRQIVRQAVTGYWHNAGKLCWLALCGLVRG